MFEQEFDAAVMSFRRALDAFVNGDPDEVLPLYSQRDDVTLANPLGPPRVGPAAVEEAIRTAAANFEAGGARKRFEEITRYVTPDLGYIVQFERTEAQLAGNDTVSPMALRVTMIFRNEDGAWKVAHRHADTITTARPIATAIDT